jgi:hypothetical protein
VDERTAVCGFWAEIDGVKFQGKVMENEEAKDTYEDAIGIFPNMTSFNNSTIASGKGAYLLEQVESDLFQVEIEYFFFWSN